MPEKPLDTDRAARLALPPARSYHIPGGPLAVDLGEVDVAKLAEIDRGGEHDKVR
jgi:hypothetical protein